MEPVVLTMPLGGTALAQLAQGDVPPDWFSLAPRSASGWRERGRLFSERAGSRWRDALAAALPASGPAAERLERAAERGFVITTGQQPGLFGGPMYTFSKAMSALALADALEQLCEVPVAPVFWAATDDSDFAEAATTYVAAAGGVRTLSLPRPSQGAGDTPLRDVPLGAVGPLIDALASTVGAAVEAELITLLRQCCASGATIGSAYVELLRAVLGPRGIAVLDAGHPAATAAARPTLALALERAADVDRALAHRDELLRAAGYEPQVARVPELSLVFTRVNGQRSRVPIAAAARARDPQAHPVLSANVLLRPIVERMILPTAAYVAGPGELAYFAQVGAVADALDFDAPVAVPRWSGMIIEPHVRRLLARYELLPGELGDPHAVEARLVRRSIDPAVMETLATLRRQISDSLAALQAALPIGDPQLPQTVVSGAERDLLHRLGRVERRIVASAKRREHELMRDIATVRAALFPFGRPQERVLNMIPLLARSGYTLLDQMHAHAADHAARLTRGSTSTSAAPSSEPHGRLSGAHGRS